MDEYVDCPYCHAASPAEEFTAGFGHCPFCGAANYELDGYMGHLGHRTASGGLDDLTQRRALNTVREWMRQRYGDEDDKDTMAPSGQHAYESGAGLKLHPSWTGSWTHPFTGEMVDDESGPSPAILHDGVPGWADDASFDDDLNDRLRGLGVQTGNWYGNVLTLHPHREWSFPPHARTSPARVDDEVRAVRDAAWAVVEASADLVAQRARRYSLEEICAKVGVDASRVRERAQQLRAEAQAAIEKAYMEKYPIGSDAPRAPRDSGVDYDSLFKPDDLDDDFGHILGSVRAAAGHKLEIVKPGRGSWMAACSCGESYRQPSQANPKGSPYWTPSEVSLNKIRQMHKDHKAGGARTAAGMSYDETMKYIDDVLAAGEPEGLKPWELELLMRQVRQDYPDYENHTDRTGSTMNRTAAIDFVAAQNTRDRDELLFRAHRHASQLTCRLTVPEAQRAVRAFVAAVNREALRTAAAPEDEACGDCGADAGEECRFYCTGKAAHDDEVAEGKRKKGSRRTAAAVMADFPDELMF
jgi:hypothetical protein